VKNIFLTYLLCLSLNVINSQTNVDSLRNVWQDASKNDTTRLKAIEKIAWDGYLFYQPDSAFYYAQQQYEFAKSSGVKKQMNSALNTQGASFYIRGNYPRAMELFQKSLALSEELGAKHQVANTLNNIGAIYREQSNYPKALEYFKKSLVIREEIGNKKDIAVSLNNIGTFYIDQGRYPQALEYLQRSLAIRKELADNRGIASSLNNIGSVYYSQSNYTLALEYYQNSISISQELDDKRGVASLLNNIGMIYEDKANYPKALENYKKSLVISEKLGEKLLKSNVLNNMGVIYRKQGNNNKALEYYQKSLEIRNELDNKSGIASTMTNIGTIYFDKKNYPQALKYCRKSLELAESIGSLELVQGACICLYDTYKAMDKSNDAMVYLEKKVMTEDSLKATETAKKLQQMEFEKVMLRDSIAKAEEALLVKIAHQEEIRQKNQIRNWSIAGGVFAFLLAGGFYSRWRFVRKSRDIISKEKKRSDNLLLNILPAEIAEELKEKGRADAQDFEMVSILFTDFKGFTAASEKLSAQDLVTEINTCFEAFDGIIGKYGIEKIKTIGDSYMAAGGLPVPSDESVNNTVLAALEMQEFVSRRKEALDAKNKPSFEMRVGVHTGPVVAGIVGVKKFQYDIWGDTVNTASRMESSGEVGRVNISEATYHLIKDDSQFNFESRGKIKAKGKREMSMYFVQKG
jgi:class 3 adenylate cyclase/tetratricopeptide (TPR) repeat protein